MPYKGRGARGCHWEGELDVAAGAGGYPSVQAVEWPAGASYTIHCTIHTTVDRERVARK